MMDENQVTIAQEDNLPQIQQEESNPFLALIDKYCTNPDFNLEILREFKIMNQEHLDRQGEIAFNKAFAEMQPQLPPIPKEGIGQNGTKYFKKETANKLVNPFLKRYGFGLSHDIKQGDGKVAVIAILSHNQGHTRTTSIELPNDVGGQKNAVQAVGSSQTYGERYTMKAILNLTIIDDETDDDGNGSSEFITREQVEYIENMLEETRSNKINFLKACKATSIAQIKAGAFKSIKTKLIAKQKEQGKEVGNESN